MNIQNILSEEFQAQAATTAAPKIKFSDLDTLQVRVLQRMADGILNVENAKENEYDIMADLAEMGLLDQEYELTRAGQKAVDIAKQIGGSAELMAARKKQQAMSQFDHQHSTGISDDPESLDGMDGMDVGPDDSAGIEDEDEFEFELNRF